MCVREHLPDDELVDGHHDREGEIQAKKEHALAQYGPGHALPARAARSGSPDGDEEPGQRERDTERNEDGRVGQRFGEAQHDQHDRGRHRGEAHCRHREFVAVLPSHDRAHSHRRVLRDHQGHKHQSEAPTEPVEPGAGQACHDPER